MRTVRNVEPNRGDGCRGRESHRTTETRQAKDETQRAYEPDWHVRITRILSASAIPDSGVKRQTGTDRGTPPTVHFVQELGAWDRTVAAEGVHHSRIRCYRKGPAKRTAKKQKRETRINMKVARPYPQKSIAPMIITCPGVVIASLILIFSEVITHHQ